MSGLSRSWCTLQWYVRDFLCIQSQIHYGITQCFYYTAPRNECTHGEIRLANGPSAYEGRIELCFHGIWSGLCVDFSFLFNSHNAAVACQQLGYHGLGELCIPYCSWDANLRDREGLDFLWFLFRYSNCLAVHLSNIFVCFKYHDSNFTMKITKVWDPQKLPAAQKLPAVWLPLLVIITMSR